jgi:hypothetical protein
MVGILRCGATLAPSPPQPRFGIKRVAESRMRTVEECRESGATGGGVIIEERERVRPR